MLQKVKEEERLHIACGSPDCSSACVIVDSQCSDPHDKLLHIDEKLQCEIPLQEPVPSLAPSLRESNLNQSGSVGELVAATFGRETTVKDKQWLKRRISMGLTNSCAVSTNFIIKDNKFAKKGNEEGCNGMYGSFAKDPSIVNQKGLPTCLVGQLDYHKVVPERRLENHNIDDYSGSDDHENEQRAAKRVRKPTKRYIEEFSEVESKESSGRLLNLAKNSGHGLMSPKSHVRLVRNVSSGGRTVVTRLDSLGGSGIQVPCVSRVRRSRPRKNFMALLKFNPSGMGMAATLVKKALDDHSFPPDDGNEDRVLKASSTPEHVHHLFVGMPEKGKQFSVMSAAGFGK
ncbi:hypothetical protein OIU78_010462 [Salix suchowensis]|nr:hypothetical protein OIU78_010462 [Salix suchowensis]